MEHRLILDRSRTMRWSMKHFLTRTRTIRFDSCHITLVDQWEDWYDPRSKFLLTPTSKKRCGNKFNPKSLLVDNFYNSLSHWQKLSRLCCDNNRWVRRLMAGSHHARISKPETPLGSQLPMDTRVLVLLRPVVKLL